MRQNICTLLILILGTSSTCIITPCQAQTPKESNSETPKNISSISSNQASIREFSNSASSSTITNEPPTIIEADNSSTSSSANIAVTKPERRIPIFSRVFPAPSMQQ